ncbi:MAG: response regulator transcription factor [Chloroflexota bacterium]
MKKTRVLLADDHTMVREGLRSLLSQTNDIEVVGEASDGEEAIGRVAALKPDVVVLDIAMPKVNGIQATKKIKEIHPSTIVLVLTAYDNDEYIYALLEAGAAGYLLKNVRGQEFIDAIRAVAAGESVLHPVVARKVLRRFIPVADTTTKVMPVEKLSDREMEVLKLAARGLDNKAIADQLYLSVRTVQSHFASIFNKLPVSSRTEAVLYGLKRGWFTLEDTSETP